MSEISSLSWSSACGHEHQADGIELWTTLTSPSDTFDGMLSAMLPFSFSKYPAVGTSKSDLRLQETPHTGNVPCLCCLSGTACGLSPRIEDTPIGCSSPVASSGGDCVPKDLFAFAEDIVGSSIEIRRGGGGGVWVADTSSVESVLAPVAVYVHMLDRHPSGRSGLGRSARQRVMA